jgi:hypothetical protein
MPDIETIKALLQGATLLILLIGLWLTIRQLQLLTKSNVDQHDWNRRKAAQDAVVSSTREIEKDTLLLDDKFKIMSRTDPFSLDEIRQQLNADEKVKIALNKRFNTLEALALGVHQGVFDEEVVKTGYRMLFRRTLLLFRAYMEHRRNTTGSPRVWREVDTLSQEWEEEEHRRRQQIANP